MQFSPQFDLLQKFRWAAGYPERSAEEAQGVAAYLGIGLPKASLDEQSEIIFAELQNQNGFLSRNLESETIVDTDEYRRSLFIREIVANNRENRAKRQRRDSCARPT